MSNKYTSWKSSIYIYTYIYIFFFSRLDKLETKPRLVSCIKHFAEVPAVFPFEDIWLNCNYSSALRSGICFLSFRIQIQMFFLKVVINSNSWSTRVSAVSCGGKLLLQDEYSKRIRQTALIGTVNGSFSQDSSETPQLNKLTCLYFSTQWELKSLYGHMLCKRLRTCLEP